MRERRASHLTQWLKDVLRNASVMKYIGNYSVYSAKGRPGSVNTKLDSGAQKHLRRSRIEGYGQRAQARTRLARAEVGERAGVRADCMPLRSPALVARADFLKIGHFAPFFQFSNIKGRNFPDDFIRSCLPMNPMNHEKFHVNGSARF